MQLPIFTMVLACVSAVVGQTVLHPNTATNKCVEIRGNVLANGTAVQIFDCNGTAAQQWFVTLGSTEVQNPQGPFCLDAGSPPFVNGALVKIWTCFSGLPAQSWFFTTDARLALEGTGFCLDLPNGNTTNTNQLQIWQCGDGNTNQIWRN